MKSKFNIKKWKGLLKALLAPALFFASSCNTLDVPPPNIVTDDDIFTSEEGVTAYLARMYRDMPIVEFYGGLRGGEGVAPDLYTGQFIECPATGTRKIGNSSLEHYGGYYNSTTKEYVRLWDYAAIRRQNYFLQEIDRYEGRPHTAGRIRELKAHTYWMRAFRYFEMVKRYGGVPIIDVPLNYPEQTIEDLKRPRDRERDCYDFILADCDRAIENFSSDPATRKAGYANRWDAYALKSRVALYAASIARYGPLYSGGHMYHDGLTGVVSDSAAYYYRTAYDAAEEVVRSNLYQLYMSKWREGDRAAIAENFSSIFYDLSSKEAMFSLQYLQLLSTAVFDANNLPYQVGTKYSGKISPTLDFVELYEYADPSLLSAALRSRSGERFRLSAELTGTDNAPRFYESPLDAFEGIEPRLEGSITLPGSECRGQTIEIRYGIMPAGQQSYNSGTLLHTASFDQEYNGMTVQGLSGMGADQTTSTGFYNRKWFDPDLPEEYIKDTSHGTVVPWQEFRYTEVLLNIAEAVVELRSLGEPVSQEMLREAADYVRQIRLRAGARADRYDANTLTVDAVRLERRKEFYMENKTFWDLRRWRVSHEEMNEKQWNLVQPVYFWDRQQYYVRRDSIPFNDRQTFLPRQYYFDIPSFARNSNSSLINNPSQNF
jgi:hypothetical protein